MRQKQRERVEEVPREETGLCGSHVLLGNVLSSQGLSKDGEGMRAQRGCSVRHLTPSTLEEMTSCKHQGHWTSKKHLG